MEEVGPRKAACAMVPVLLRLSTRSATPPGYWQEGEPDWNVNIFEWISAEELRGQRATSPLACGLFPVSPALRN